MIQEEGLGTLSVTTTSRAPRHYEVEGKDYYFVGDAEFEELIETNRMVEYDSFNNWYYGITQEEFDRTNVSIVTPRGLQRYRKVLGRDNLYVIYVDTPLDIRYERIKKRGDDPSEALRRFVADEMDFEGFVDWDYRIDGSDESYIDTIRHIYTIIA